MADEQNFIPGQHASKSIPKKKENIRVFVQRKRLSSSYLTKAASASSNSFEQLTSIIEKSCNKNKRNTIVINYRPVFMNASEEKPSANVPPTPIPSAANAVPPKTAPPSRRKSASYDVPDVEDPLMFIEMMYQQMFNEDGQLKSGAEPAALANCVKQIVTQSRRNSFVRRDSLMANHVPHHQKTSPISFQHPTSSRRTSMCTSPRFLHQPLSEEEEDTHTLTHRMRPTSASRRSSQRPSFDYADQQQQQQQFHALLNSYQQQQQKASSSHRSAAQANYPASADDTDNEDLDTFSDLNSYRKPVRQSPAASVDEDSTPLLSSSGYQSAKTGRKKSAQEESWCPNCTQTPEAVLSPAAVASASSPSTTHIFQSIRETLMKYVNFVLISKNILLVPLIVFLLRQRSIPISN